MERLSPFIAALILGYIADLLFGDPEKMPHPVRLFGNLIATGEKRLNTGSHRFIKGMLLAILLTGGTFIIFFFADQYLHQVNRYAAIAFNALFVYFGLANKSLIDESRNVFKKLIISLDAGRQQVARIVGRETKNLTTQQVKTAVFETMSENLSDGVIAPLFFYAIGGVPAMMAFKMISTLDSMIGYRNARYEQFGKFSARMDDVVNYIPARITVLLLAVASLNYKALSFAVKYGRCHKSPNSGYPEAALAGILNCRFGGPNYYHGELVEKPYIGENARDIEDNEINKVVYLNQACAFLFIVIICGIDYLC